MLAYSSVAQAGYMLIGVVAFDGGDGGALGAALFYLVGYTVMTVSAFLALGAVGPDADGLDDLAGLGRRAPFLGVCLTLIFLGLAGLPPGMVGMIGKVLLFSAALKQELYGLVIVAALNSALACAYYLRVPATIWFKSAAPSAEPIHPAILTWATLGLCAAAVVLFGVFPEPILRVVTAAVAALLQ
jgi:NADH-quinone oxidoreductase subunit N